MENPLYILVENPLYILMETGATILVETGATCWWRSVIQFGRDRRYILLEELGITVVKTGTIFLLEATSTTQ